MLRIRSVGQNSLPLSGKKNWVSIFAPLEHICAFRGNLKGNHKQSVVELNA